MSRRLNTKLRGCCLSTLCFVISAFVMSACGGGGGGGGDSPANGGSVGASVSASIGGSVSGLASGASVTLQNNGGNNLNLAANGSYAFSIPVASGSPYAVTIFTQPSGQTCTVKNGSGTAASGSVTDAAVACVSPPPPPSATAGISSEMSSAYSTQSTAFASDASALKQQLNGQAAAMAEALIDAKLSHTQTFLTNAVAMVQKYKNLGYGIDQAAITGLFNEYQAQDLALARLYFAGSSLNGVLDLFILPANAAYATAVVRIFGTADLSGYMSILYLADKMALALASAAGDVCTDKGRTDLVNLKIVRVQIFVSSALEAVQINRTLGYAVNKASVVDTFGLYQVQDVGFVSSLVCGLQQGTLSVAATTTLTPAVNTAYRSAIAQINAM